MGKVETSAPVQLKPATQEATTPAPSTAAVGSSTPTVATGSPEVKPAKPTQTAVTPITSGPAQPAAPEAKSQSGSSRSPSTTSQQRLRLRLSSVMRSSVMPSEKYSCSCSPDMLVKGSTATDGVEGSGKSSVVTSGSVWRSDITTP